MQYNLKIGVCDDTPEILSFMKKDLSVVAFEENIEIEIELFQDGRDLLSETIPFDLLFLDVEMPEIDGFELAQKMKRKYETEVVFVTSHQEWIQQSIEYRPFAYLYKPVSKEELRQVFSRYIRELENEGLERVLVKTENGTASLLISEIVMIEAADEETKIHTSGDTYFSREIFNGKNTIFIVFFVFVC